nr:unnamed protein product [Haemonchus contortus]
MALLSEWLMIMVQAEYEKKKEKKKKKKKEKKKGRERRAIHSNNKWYTNKRYQCIYPATVMDSNNMHPTSMDVRPGCTTHKTDLENLSIFSQEASQLLLGEPYTNTRRNKAFQVNVLLGWNYSGWQGTAAYKLFTNAERRNYEANPNIWGSKKLEDILREIHLITEETTRYEGRKRAANHHDIDDNSSKLARREPVLLVVGIPATL